MARLARRVQRRITRRLIHWNVLIPREWPLVNELMARRRARHMRIRLARNFRGKVLERDFLVEREWPVEREWLPRRNLRHAGYAVRRRAERPLLDTEPAKQRSWLVRREIQWAEFRLNRQLRRRPGVRAGAAVTMTFSGALAGLYAFLVVVAQVNVGHNLTTTLIAIGLLLIWLGGAWNRSRTGAWAVQRSDRERRGF
jgi:hypothetical protein